MRRLRMRERRYEERPRHSGGKYHHTPNEGPGRLHRHFVSTSGVKGIGTHDRQFLSKLICGYTCSADPQTPGRYRFSRFCDGLSLYGTVATESQGLSRCRKTEASCGSPTASNLTDPSKQQRIPRPPITSLRPQPRHQYRLGRGRFAILYLRDPFAI